MDESLAAAARALSQGDPLGALKLVALRDDAQALALRGTALAQLGEYKTAAALFRRATKSFRQTHALARARCALALAEIALATRELKHVDASLTRAIAVLERHDDRANARYARLLRARAALSLGQVSQADVQLQAVDVSGCAPALRALWELARAEVALRQMRPREAQAALARASEAALRAQIPALIAEVHGARAALAEPVARLVDASGAAPVGVEQVAALLAGPALVVDGCRRSVQMGSVRVRYDTKPVLFALIRCLAEASPREVRREELIRAGFGIGRPNDSLRARLRVALGRVRKQLAPLADVRATANGFALTPRAGSVHVLLPPIEDDASRLLALLSDGEAWSSSALALALGSGQRTVQRALSTLLASGKVQSFGRGKNRRWLAPALHRFATHLLLRGASPEP